MGKDQTNRIHRTKGGSDQSARQSRHITHRPLYSQPECNRMTRESKGLPEIGRHIECCENECSRAGRSENGKTKECLRIKSEQQILLKYITKDVWLEEVDGRDMVMASRHKKSACILRMLGSFLGIGRSAKSRVTNNLNRG